MSIQSKQKESTAKEARSLTGIVVSDRMKDTVVVEVSRYKKFPKYGKYMVRTKRLKAHDAGNTCSTGDVVLLKPTRPISKDKHYMIVRRLKIKDQNDTEQ